MRFPTRDEGASTSNLRTFIVTNNTVNRPPAVCPDGFDIVAMFRRLNDAERAGILDLVGPPPLSPAIRAGIASVARSARKAA